MIAYGDLGTVAAVATAIVCDWNGTVVDDTDRAIVATNQTLAEFGIAPLDPSAFGSAFRLPLSDFFQVLGIAAGDCDEAIFDWNQRLAAGDARLSAGVTDLLRTAKDLAIPVGIVSAADEAVVRADADLLGISQDLAFIVGGAVDKSLALREIAVTLGGAIIYIGDTEYDLDAASRAGVIGLGFGGGYRPASALREVETAIGVIDDFAVLSSALRRGRQ